VFQGQGRRGAVERRSGLVSRGARVPPTRSSRCYWYRDALTWLLGSRGPGSHEPESSDEGGCPSLRARTGHRARDVGSERSGGAETQESIGRRFGATRAGANGLAGGSRLRSRRSWRNGAVLPLGAQGDRAACLRVRERELIATGGTRQLRLTAWKLAKPVVTRHRESRPSTLVDNDKEAGGPERGARFLRGERSEGRNPRNGCGT
jgi:hypothetical protein